MTTLLESTVDPTTLNAMTWPSLWAGAVQQASLVLLGLVTALLVALIAAAFIRPASALPTTHTLSGGGSFTSERLALAEPWYEPPLAPQPRPELVPAVAGRSEPLPITIIPSGRPVEPASLENTSTQAPRGVPQPLYQAGLSPTDALALLSLRDRVRSGLVSESPLDPNQLAFSRWLIQHGRLAG